MFQRYFAEPYRFIPPYRSTFWCRLARWIVPGHLRRRMQVHRWKFQGVDGLRDSLKQGAGIMLAANHCRWADPVVLGMLGLEVERFFYYVVSYHLFKQSRLSGWYMNRLGGFSIWREGADRSALRSCAGILAEAKRPLVLFPEGTWFRQNDRLGRLQEGLSLIARQAAQLTAGPLAIHPVAIKYWFLEDPGPALRRRLNLLEERLGWRAQRDLELLPRLEKLGSALLSVKEIEYFGRVQRGTLDERIICLARSHVSALEKYYLGREQDGGTLERIRRLRQPLARRLIEQGAESAEGIRVHQALDTLLFCENLCGHSWDYVQQHPSPERLGETLQRIEETVTDQEEEPLGALGAVVAVGQPIDPRRFSALRGNPSRGTDPLIGQLTASIQDLLTQLLAQGPPPEWERPAVLDSPLPSRPLPSQPSDSPIPFQRTEVHA